MSNLLKKMGIVLVEECDEDENKRDSWSSNDVLLISIITIIIGTILLLFGMIASFTPIKGINEHTYLFSITWGIIIVLFSIFGSYVAVILNKIEVMYEELSQNKISDKGEKVGYYRRKKHEIKDINVLSEKNGLWETPEGNVSGAAEISFDLWGEERYLLGLWSENNPEKIEYKLTHSSLYDLYFDFAPKENIDNVLKEAEDLKNIPVTEKYESLCVRLRNALENRIKEEDLYCMPDIRRMVSHWED